MLLILKSKSFSLKNEQLWEETTSNVPGVPLPYCIGLPFVNFEGKNLKFKLNGPNSSDVC